MSKFSFALLHIAVIAISLENVNCMSKEEESFMMMLSPVIMDCMKECNMKEEDLDKDSINPCFAECFLKGLGLLNEKGQFDLNDLKTNISKLIMNKNDEEKVLNYIDRCFKGKEDELKTNFKAVDIFFQCMKDLPK